MKVVVTGGGTIAPIDAVRQITNRSTGRFAAELTEVLLGHGCEVWHISAPGSLLPFAREASLDLDVKDLKGEVERLRGVRERYHAASSRLHLTPLQRGTVEDYSKVLRAVLTEREIDVAFLAMAVSDYEPRAVDGKIASNLDELEIRCVRTPKVIRAVRDWAPGVFLVAFKLLVGASTETLRNAGLVSCRVNRADLCAANTIETVAAGRHEILAVAADGRVRQLGPEPSAAEGLAALVLEEVEQRARGRDFSPAREQAR